MIKGLSHGKAPIIWHELMGCRRVYVKEGCGVTLRALLRRYFCKNKAAVNFII